MQVNVEEEEEEEEEFQQQKKNFFPIDDVDSRLNASD